MDDPDSQDSENRPEPYGCWDEIYDILRKPVLVDRNIPRELKTLWQRVAIQLLATEQSRTDLYPIASDLVFILPKLVLSHPPGKEKGKARIHRIQECLRQASQGEWPHLIERAMQMDTPNQEQDASQLLPPGPTPFLRGLQRDYTKPRPRDSLAKHGVSSVPHLPSMWDQNNGKRRSTNSPLTKTQMIMYLSERESHLTDGILLPGSTRMPSQSSSATKLQMQVGGQLKQLRAARTTTIKTSNPCMDSQSGYCHHRPRPAGRTVAISPTCLFRQGGRCH